ncbi:hypothetical protein [Acinetobacter radioresistens]|uniref:hypothetical protein n=1 Tax=Acinetobacter radioresistens TaxID=40216 RepID=UPI0009465349|nr:hypothetical protein [Acinetobacter radioresistens]
MNANNDEGKLISGKEALIALANGEKVEYKEVSGTWRDASLLTVNTILNFDDGCLLFRLAPRTITINGIEVPAPFKPKEGNECFILNVESEDGFYRFVYGENSGFHKKLIQLGAWRTEEEIKQVVAALRQVFGGAV